MPLRRFEDDGYTRALATFGQRSPRPEAIVVISAHWEARGPVPSMLSPSGFIYDFAGFPGSFTRWTIRARCAALAADALRAPRLRRHRGGRRDGARLGPWSLGSAEAAGSGGDDPDRRDLEPVVRSPALMFHIGEALRPLRSRGVLLIGSGGIVHNLHLLRWVTRGRGRSWAAAFDEWVVDRVERVLRGPAGFRLRGPHADLAAPTTEHLDPLSSFWEPRRRRIGRCRCRRVHYGNLSMRTLALVVGEPRHLPPHPTLSKGGAGEESVERGSLRRGGACGGCAADFVPCLGEDDRGDPHLLHLAGEP